MENTRSSNYASDRSTNFKHHVPQDIGLPRAVTVEEYVAGERAKQMSKLRDWHLNSRNGGQCDSVALRDSFSNSRSYVCPSPVQELDHHKGYLILGAVVATILGSNFFFCH